MSISPSDLPEGVLFGMGNPLLDIQALVEPDFLVKYDLKVNDAILAEKKHDDLCEEMKKRYDVEYVAGGATQNSIKVAQWMLGHAGACTYMGCVGRDRNGETLRQRSTALGVNVHYQYVDSKATGTCACLITGENHENRSLVTRLAAAEHFTKDHLDEAENKKLMEKARVYYIGGFFLTVSVASMLEVAAHACGANKTFSLNLSAPFLPQFFKEPLMKVMPYVDILFGSELEAVAFASHVLDRPDLGEESIKDIALLMCQLPKANPARQRLVVITHDARPTVVARGGEVAEYPVIRCPPSDIVDTNGAGDAFVGGFLSQLVLGAAVGECVRAGHYTANIVIKRSGCTLPEKPMFI